MRKTLTLLAFFLLSACKNDASQPQVVPSETPTPQETQEPKLEETEKTLQSLLESGDSSACANDTVKNSLLENIRPGYIGWKTVPEDAYNVARSSFGSIEQIVFDGFDGQTFKMQCSANFSAGDGNPYPISYTLQPTTDKSDVIIKSESTALSKENSYKFRSMIIESMRR